MLSTGFVVVHDPGRGGEEDKAELTGWEELGDPIFNVLEFDVVPWSANERPSDRAKRGARGGALALEHTTSPSHSRDHTGLVQSPIQLDDNLACTVVVDFFKFVDVA